MLVKTHGKSKELEGLKLDNKKLSKFVQNSSLKTNKTNPKHTPTGHIGKTLHASQKIEKQRQTDLDKNLLMKWKALLIIRWKTGTHLYTLT